ncbi:MAG: DUF305 domain-containing protein [Gemmatimonadales bacterium]|nr:DUF305 domain-containing protein [Gemmatimonadales bacterium]
MRTFFGQSLAALAAATLLTSIGPDPAAAQAARRYVQADAEFLQGMIAHHAQAVAMSVLMPKRSKSEALNSLAERIVVSQKDEINLMRQWLLDHGAEAPDPLKHPGHHDHELMPGMLTAEEMAQLAAATGPEFEQLFLKGMIKHHEGAIAMVTALYRTPGAAQDLVIYRMATDIEADQRAEIARMRALLKP